MTLVSRIGLGALLLAACGSPPKSHTSQLDSDQTPPQLGQWTLVGYPPSSNSSNSSFWIDEIIVSGSGAGATSGTFTGTLGSTSGDSNQEITNVSGTWSADNGPNGEEVQLTFNGQTLAFTYGVNSDSSMTMVEENDPNTANAPTEFYVSVAPATPPAPATATWNLSGAAPSSGSFWIVNIDLQGVFEGAPGGSFTGTIGCTAPTQGSAYPPCSSPQITVSSNIPGSWIVFSASGQQEITLVFSDGNNQDTANFAYQLNSDGTMTLTGVSDYNYANPGSYTLSMYISARNDGFAPSLPIPGDHLSEGAPRRWVRVH